MSATASCCANKSPWRTSSSGNADQPIKSFVEIMNEELAITLQKEDEANHHQDNKETEENYNQFSDQSFSTKITTEFDELDSNSYTDFSDDLILARLLQHEFDREHDKMVLRQQNRLNGNSKIKILFDKYLCTHPLDDTESSCDDDEEMREFVINMAYDHHNPKNFSIMDAVIIAKHGNEVTASKSTIRVFQLLPDFPIGDAIDLNLNNKVFNDLKNHSIKCEKRRQRIKSKSEYFTTIKFIGFKTWVILYELLKVEILQSINELVVIRKESVVLTAIAYEPIKMKECMEDGAEPLISFECAIKIHATVLNEFRNRVYDVKDDIHYKISAEKEFHNLNRMNSAGLRCPQVVHLSKHVLVLSLIGENGNPAPTLNRVTFVDISTVATAFHECRQFITRLYRECHLVHADLSEFNVLYWKGHCWFVDIAQAVDTSHPEALSFLSRDCHNILAYFRETGLAELPSLLTMFSEISLKTITNKWLYTQVKRSRKDKMNYRLKSLNKW